MPSFHQEYDDGASDPEYSYIGSVTILGHEETIKAALENSLQNPNNKYPAFKWKPMEATHPELTQIGRHGLTTGENESSYHPVEYLKAISRSYPSLVFVGEYYESMSYNFHASPYRDPVPFCILAEEEISWPQAESFLLGLTKPQIPEAKPVEVEIELS